MNIRHKDLNLLAIFSGIAEEMNLSRASTRLGLSQPALSHALARMREQFGDPLFVRGQRGLVATPRALELLPQVRTVLEAAEGLYGPAEKLDLSSIERKIVIAATTYFEARAIAGFIRHAQVHAPGLTIETRPLSGEFPKRELESGEFDVAIAAYFHEVPGGLKIRTIFSDRFVSVCSRTNLYYDTGRTLADYLAQRHLQIEVPPGVVSPVDQFLQRKKKKRHIVLRIGNFFTPPALLAQTDLMLTCPLSLAESYLEAWPLAICELPFNLPRIRTNMIWHEKSDRDPLHQWLRECLAHPQNLGNTS